MPLNPVSLMSSIAVYQPCPAGGAVEAKRYKAGLRGSAMVPGEGRCVTGLVAMGAESDTWFFYFCGISGGSHARGGSRKEQALVLRGWNSGIGEENSRDSIYTCGRGTPRPVRVGQ